MKECKKQEEKTLKKPGQALSAEKTAYSALTKAILKEKSLIDEKYK